MVRFTLILGRYKGSDRDTSYVLIEASDHKHNRSASKALRFFSRLLGACSFPRTSAPEIWAQDSMAFFVRSGARGQEYDLRLVLQQICASFFLRFPNSGDLKTSPKT